MAELKNAEGKSLGGDKKGKWKEKHRHNLLIGKNRRNPFIMMPSPRKTEEKHFLENVRTKNTILFSLICCREKNSSAIILLMYEKGHNPIKKSSVAQRSYGKSSQNLLWKKMHFMVDHNYAREN